MPTKEEVAFRLAQSHYSVEPGIVRIHRLVRDDREDDDPTEPIKLLEVNEDSLPLGIRAVYFRAHPASGIIYPSSIVEVTPEEFEALSRGDGGLSLPTGWRLGDPIDRTPSVEILTVWHGARAEPEILG
jgi:hypothetical protein